MYQERAPKPKILVFVGTYLPGYKGGGPVRSVSNLVTALQDEFEFRIVTSDRDMSESEPYPVVVPDEWNDRKGIQVLYLSPGLCRFVRIARLLYDGKFDMLYVNSCFARAFSMFPVWLKWFGVAASKPLLIAPRGEFSIGALSIHATRKSLYNKLSKTLKVYDAIHWHASTAMEEADICLYLGRKSMCNIAEQVSLGSICIASDVGQFETGSNRLYERSRAHKLSGQLRVVFVGRVSRMKNLDYALRLLPDVQGEVVCNIFGPLEDKVYWEECRRIVADMPTNISVNYKGVLRPEQVGECLEEHHALLLPTRGENFGHVIIEALCAGCVVVISDRSPWKNLREYGCGFDCPLEDRKAFVDSIQRCIDMNEDAFRCASAAARKFGENVIGDQRVLDANRTMFARVLQRQWYLMMGSASQY